MAAPGYGDLLDALRGVTWPARRAALAGTAGTHRSLLRGLSAEFTEYRPYRQGDDPRRLDWKLFARTDRAYLRITSDRATLGTVIVVDASLSMAFPEGTLDKWHQACRLAVGLAAVAHGSGDPVGCVVSGAGDPRHVAPRTRRGIIAEIIRVLEATDPSSHAPRTTHHAPSSHSLFPVAYSPPLAPLLASLRRSPRLLLISDLLGDGPALLREASTLLAGGTDVLVAHVVARRELDPPGRAVLAVDPEHPDLRRPLVAESREAYLGAFAAWRADTAHAWRAAGASYTEVTDDEPAARAVRRVVALQPAAAR